MAKELMPFIGPITMVDQVRNAIAEAIYRGDLPTGERLTHDKIAAQLGVPREPILVAMLDLSRQGLIVDSGRAGVKVAPIDPIQMAHLYQVRGALDMGAAREAAQYGTSVQWRRLKALLVRGDAAHRRGDRSELVASDVAFHLHIYEMSSNPLFATTAEPLWAPLRRVMSAVLADAASQEQVAIEHAAIADALMARDGERAAHLLREHVVGATRRLARSLARRGKRT